MHRPRIFPVATAVAVALTLAACGSDDGDDGAATTSTRPAAGADADGRPIVKAGDNTTLGRIVVDDQGGTVYTLTDASGAAVSCEGSCLAAWPPVLIVEGTSATGGTGVDGVGSVEGPEGEQATIDDLPLYTFAGDAQAGDATGDGIVSFGGTWKVVKLSGGTGGAGGSGGGTGGSTDSSTTTTLDAYGY
jgi:predicted lipoprotein with Yx(FWY)xxD motif